MLLSMQWRRALTFAAIHLAVAFAIVASLEATDAAMVREHVSHIASRTHRPPESSATILRVAQDTAPDFSLCGLIDQTSPAERVLTIANPPAVFLTAWRMPCPPRWSAAGMLLGTGWDRLTPATLPRLRAVDGILLILIAAQWLLVGGFPLRPQQNLRRDPAAIITFCTVLSGALSFLPQFDWLSGVPMLVAAVAWLFWLAPLSWKILRFIGSQISRARSATH